MFEVYGILLSHWLMLKGIATDVVTPLIENDFIPEYLRLNHLDLR